MQKTKILVVDDNIDLLKLLDNFLTSKGYEIFSCDNGKEAKNNFLEFAPDIVITDIVMPESDGIELLMDLRKINPHINVIAISGGNRGYAGEYLHMAEKLGANSVLSKPFELSRLLEEVKMLEAAV